MTTENPLDIQIVISNYLGTPHELYESYTGPSGPSQLQAFRNDLALHKLLPGSTLTWETIPGTDDQGTCVTFNGRSASYDRWGYCEFHVKGKESALDQASLQDTVLYLLDVPLANAVFDAAMERGKTPRSDYDLRKAQKSAACLNKLGRELIEWFNESGFVDPESTVDSDTVYAQFDGGEKDFLSDANTYGALSSIKLAGLLCEPKYDRWYAPFGMQELMSKKNQEKEPPAPRRKTPKFSEKQWLVPVGKRIVSSTNDPYEFVVEASTLRIPPGNWPQYIPCAVGEDALGNGKPFEKYELFAGKVIYKQCFGKVIVTVLND